MQERETNEPEKLSVQISEAMQTKLIEIIISVIAFLTIGGGHLKPFH